MGVNGHKGYPASKPAPSPMATEIIITRPLVKPGYTLRVVFEHRGHRREALWFKYKKRGDLLLCSRARHDRVGRGKHSDTDPITGAGIRWLSADDKRDHFTLHPSVRDHPTKSGAAVNGPGGIQPIGLDLRTLQERLPLFQHRLTTPEAYPEAPKGVPQVFLGRAYAPGAPELHVWAAPIDAQGHAGPLLPPAPSGGAEFIIAPAGLGERTYLLQIRLIHDPSLPHWPYDTLSFPEFSKAGADDAAAETAP